MSKSRTRGLERLSDLQEVSRDNGKEMKAIGERFEDLAGRGKPKVVSSFNLFPTPPAIAKQVIEAADLHKRYGMGMKILEPSFGTGRLIEAMQAKNLLDWNLVTGVEINADLCEHARSQKWNMEIECADFLEWNSELKYPKRYFDRVMMNPPFKNGVDRIHIERACGMLDRGGRLVSLLAAGPKQREWYANLRRAKPSWIRSVVWVDLPSGSFKSEGTEVETAMVVIQRE